MDDFDKKIEVFNKGLVNKLVEKECGMNKSVKGEQEWPPKKVSVKVIKEQWDILEAELMTPHLREFNPSLKP